jgi:WD40 repeat protein
VGHQHKITCVRLFNNEKNVITGSADRSLKVWDIARKTYRQTVTLRHSSTANCVDVESETAVTGHHDGGLRFWDLKSGDRTENISGTRDRSHVVAVRPLLLQIGYFSCTLLLFSFSGKKFMKMVSLRFNSILVTQHKF